MKNNDKAIIVNNISKKFKIPHEKHGSLRSVVFNIFKRNKYTVHEAAKNISFEVKKGEFFGIIGRNGSGKSTLLKMLAGIYVPDSGEITINGKLSPFLELGVGFNPELTARENVYLGGAMLGLPKKEISSKFNKIIEFAELEEFVDTKFKNFSSGMQVRLAFALSINAHAEILLMDEVLAVGDSSFQAKCIDEFLKYKKEGKTVLLVTHDTGAVQRYCDRALLMNNGKIEKIGNADELVHEYHLENMRLEEKRLSKSENRKNKKGSESDDSTPEKADNQKVGLIRGVDLIDKSGRPKEMFETGEEISIRVRFGVYKDVEGVNLGIGMYRVDKDERVFSYNTQVDRYKIETGSDHDIVLKINSANILQGNYYLNVALFGNTEDIYYDIKQNFKYFKMFSKGVKSEYKGMVDLKHSWSQTVKKK
jgi:ABC-type polysaccharide/polyol phosphate transport system ATPase subunit